MTNSDLGQDDISEDAENRQEASVASRLERLEERLDALATVCNHVRVLAESANQLATVLESRVAVLSEGQEWRQPLEQLLTSVGDIQRLAAPVWEQAAMTRRIARIEDLLLGEGKSDDATRDQ